MLHIQFAGGRNRWIHTEVAMVVHIIGILAEGGLGEFDMGAGGRETGVRGIGFPPPRSPMP